MASLRDIRRRIKSVKNTAQITKAMQMVAASKMRKAQEAALNGRPYALLLNRVLVSLRNRLDQNLHPLLEKREVKNELVVVLSTDKGLCGGLNTNLLREVTNFDTQTTKFISVGRKGTQFLARTKRNMIADFPLKEQPNVSRDQGHFQIFHREVSERRSGQSHCALASLRQYADAKADGLDPASDHKS